MTTIDIRLIRPSPNPIRKTWDEDKMQELAASIKERGVIVPIKVRPAGDEYEVVYGHRRVEASRRAGLEEVPAIVEATDDSEALIQALIENVQREDMEPIDKAESLAQIKLMKGWSNRDLERYGVIEQSYASRLIALLDELPEVKSMVKSGGANVEGVDQINTISEMHVAKVRQAGLDREERKAVLFKASDEKLNRDETRAVADAYKAAPTPELKDAVLNTSGKLGDADRILEVARMKVGVNNMTERHEVERRQAYEEYDQAAKDFFDFTAHALRFAKSTQNTVRYGKFSPEAARFAIRRIDSLMEELTTLKEALEGVN